MLDELDAEAEHAAIGRARKRELASRAGEVFAFWLRATGREPSRYRFTQERRRHVEARLKEYPVEDIKRAILNVARSPFHQGENDGGRRYDDLVTICRNGSKLEMYRDLAPVGDDEIVVDSHEHEKTQERKKIQAAMTAAMKRGDHDEYQRLRELL